MNRRVLVVILVFAILAFQGLSGCFGKSPIMVEEDEDSPFGFPQEIPSNVWYHYAGGINALSEKEITAANLTVNLSGNNLPIWTNGSYFGIGMTTFEPTIGITSADNLFISSWGNGPAGSTAIVRCSGLIEMTALEDYTCVNTYDPVLPVANSNDPYVYVDKWTDRVMKFDMHALLGMTVEWSDDEGDTWSQPPTVATSVYSVQDHQTITSSPYPAALHETTWVFCINGNAPHPLCSTSIDGGATWSPEVSGSPINCNSGGLTAHLEGANDGNFYRGNIGCNGDGYSIYRSTNGGYTWTEHP
ncbi:MAG: sialidase family protein, partial [Candidatus Poseidoniaceae archaeon]|nr:sialidase family protein [Candidatus Poseidoniaceae archaeon]